MVNWFARLSIVCWTGFWYVLYLTWWSYGDAFLFWSFSYLFFCSFLPLCCCVGFLSPLLLLLKGQIRQQDNLHSLYILILTWVFPAMCRLSWLKWLWLDRLYSRFFTIFSPAVGGCFLFEDCCLFTELLFRGFVCMSFLNLFVSRSMLLRWNFTSAPKRAFSASFLIEPISRLKSSSGITFARALYC